MEVNWAHVFVIAAIFVLICFIAAFIECELEARKRRREQADREEYQRRGKSE